MNLEVPYRKDETPIKGRLQKLQDLLAFLVVGQEGHTRESIEIVRHARVGMFRALGSTRKLVGDHDFAAALIAWIQYYKKLIFSHRL